MQATGENRKRVKVMVVDDELHVLDSLSRVIDDELYEVVMAASGEEALSLLERSPVEIIVADYRMPGMNGVQLLKETLKRWPDTVRIILSGYADIQSVIEAINEGGIYRFITKPWDNRELKITLAHAAERYEMAQRNRQLADELKNMLEKNRYTEFLYRNLTEKSFAGIYVIQDGVFRLININAAAYAGYTADELREKPSNLMLVHPDDRDLQKKKAREMLKGISRDPYEFRIVTKNGDVRWIMETLVSIQYEGRPAILGNSMDVTAIKETERKLKDSEDRYRLLTEKALAGIYVIQDGLFCFVNEKAAAYTEYGREELIGTSSKKLVHPEDWERLARQTREMLAGTRTEPYEFRLVTKNGKVRWLMESSIPVMYQGRHAVLANCMDITAQKEVESRLKDNEQALESIIQGTPIPLFVIGRDHRVIYWNRSLEKLSGITAEGMVGTNGQWRAFYREPRPCIADLIVDENTDALAEGGGSGIARSTLIEGAYEAVNFFPNLGDKGRWLHYTAAPVRNAAGEMIGAIETLEDITELKLFEAQLESRLRFEQTLLDAIPQPVYYKDRDGIYLGCNKAYEEFLNISRDRLVGRSVIDVAPQKLAGVYHEKDLELFERPGNQSYQSQVLDSNHGVHDVIFHRATFNGPDGGVAGLIGTIFDVTDLKILERKLRESEELYRMISEKSFAGVYVVQDRVFKFINNTAAAYAGFTAGELEGKPSQTMLVHPDDREMHSSRAREMIKGLRKEPLEFRIMTKDGQVRWIMETLAPIVYEGRPAVLGNSMEITTQKQAEEKLVHAMKQLEKAYEDLASIQAKSVQQQKMASIGQLSAGIAHEINNPMGFISGNLGVLETYAASIESIINIQREALQQPADAERLRAVDREWKRLKIARILDDIHSLIQESIVGADRIKKIVQDLMRFSISDEAEHKPGDINDSLARVLSVLKNDIAKKATLKEEWGKLPHTRCNIGTLSQAFINIITNALQAISGQGEIAVKTWVEDDNIMISVTDTGLGIAEDVLPRIFEPFFTTRDVGEGMGLGLSSAYETVKRHRGEISVKSEVGKGTEVTLKIPVVA